MDVEERDEVSAQHPEVVASLSEEMDRMAATIWSTQHKVDPQCKATAISVTGASTDLGSSCERLHVA